MNCSRDLVEAYLDEELDATQQTALKQHLAVCPACSEVYARLRKQKADVKQAASYYIAPPMLQRSIGEALQRLSVAEAKPPRKAPWPGLAIAASLLLAISVSWNLLQLRQRSSPDDMAKNVLADHIRSLVGSRLVDVASSDQHTVKPWFAGKLDFSPDVKDLEAQGFPLAGGRVDYLADRRVAALVYHRRQHVITLFIWPSGSSPVRDATVSHNGYHLLQWTDGTMTYWAVSDASLPELQTFRALLKQAG
jgi:anti-sigma factor RsiW